ncbi:MAG TPA: hypothetical protein VGG33_21255 [Polyangia bacterium]
MDETPEELEQIRREAAQIDPYRYRNRKRIFAAVALGALMAGLTFVVIEAIDVARNPCERVRDHYCKQDAASANCKTYGGVFEESVEETSSMARSSIRHQCETHIKRLKLDEGVEVP